MGVLMALIAVSVRIVVKVPHAERGAGREKPRPSRLGIARAGVGRRNHGLGPKDDFLKLWIGAPEQNAAPVNAIVVDVRQVVPKQIVRLAAAACATEEKLIDPLCINGGRLWAWLGRPRPGFQGFVLHTTLHRSRRASECPGRRSVACLRARALGPAAPS